jgi:hypothetical protein
MEVTTFKRTGHSGKRIEFNTPQVDQSPTYPNAFFLTNKHKPPVTIAINSAEAFAYTTDHAKEAWGGREEPNAGLLAAFLYECALRFPKETLKEDWVSYTIKIGSAQEEIGPMNLLLRKNGSGLSIGKGHTMKDDDWKGPFYKTCAAYRLKKAKESADTSYTSGMNSKLVALGKSCVWKLVMPTILDTIRFEGIMDDPDIKKVFAAVDMFLTRFESHELGFIRAGTLISRYKQCMGLLDLFFADTAFYIPRGEILQWIYIDQVADQIVRMYETPDEIGDMYSYMPYCVDLELVGKSPYSATANDAIHNWTHILGCLSGLDRSRKASVVGSPAPALVWAAATSAYGMGKSAVLRQTFLRGKEQPLPNLGDFTMDQVATIEAFTKGPITKDARSWVAWANLDQSRQVVSNYFAIQVRHFKKDRPRSMEAFLADYRLM